jgi:hypothetical protein
MSRSRRVRTFDAFTRAGEVLVAVAFRGELEGFVVPAGSWLDVYRTATLLLAERG